MSTIDKCILWGLIVVIVLYLLSVILSPLYFKFGIFKWFFHNVMEWHIPAEESSEFDGCSFHNQCKFCKKEIMQDSQGNWF